MKHYETVFILTPVLSEAQVKEAVGKYTSLLEDKGAKISNLENWGLKKLAYPIQKKSTGFYNLIEFTAENGSFIGEFELAMKRDERIMRFLTVKLDKHAVAYAEKRKDRVKAEA
jgi:small subunit ribosomal protein S6